VIRFARRRLFPPGSKEERAQGVHRPRLVNLLQRVRATRTWARDIASVYKAQWRGPPLFPPRSRRHRRRRHHLPHNVTRAVAVARQKVNSFSAFLPRCQNITVQGLSTSRAPIVCHSLSRKRHLSPGTPCSRRLSRSPLACYGEIFTITTSSCTYLRRMCFCRLIAPPTDIPGHGAETLNVNSRKLHFRTGVRGDFESRSPKKYARPFAKNVTATQRRADSTR
jgi:hypothetical protein